MPRLDSESCLMQQQRKCWSSLEKMKTDGRPGRYVVVSDRSKCGSDRVTKRREERKRMRERGGIPQHNPGLPTSVVDNVSGEGKKSGGEAARVLANGLRQSGRPPTEAPSYRLELVSTVEPGLAGLRQPAVAEGSTAKTGIFRADSLFGPGVSCRPSFSSGCGSTQDLRQDKG